MFRSVFHLQLAIAIVLASVHCLLAPAAAQTDPLLAQLAESRPRITQPIDDEVTIHMAGTAPQLPTNATDVGRIDNGTRLGPMLLTLRSSPEQKLALQALLNEQQDKRSPYYHRWLTPDEFGQSFGVHRDDLDQIAHWLLSGGLKIDWIANGRRAIMFSGTAAQVEAVFHTQIHRYLIEGVYHYSNNSDISVPLALNGLIDSVLGLNDSKPRPVIGSTLSGFGGLGLKYTPTPDHTDLFGNHYLLPGDFAVIYNTLPLLSAGYDGAGVKIAVLGQSNIDPNDVQKFRDSFLPSYPANPVVIFTPSGDPGKNDDEAEGDLDVEWAGAVAPKAQIIYVASSTVQIAGAYAVDENLADIVNVSYSECEAAIGTSFSSMWEQAASQGITVFVSSGDSGSTGSGDPNYGCDYATETAALHGYGVNAIASTPHNVAVGGSQFNEGGNDSSYWSYLDYTTDNPPLLYTSALQYIPETTWNESGSESGGSQLFSGGGGVSSCYSKPPWQLGPGIGTKDPRVPDPLARCPTPTGQHRYLPDVSLSAAKHGAYLICTETAPVVGTCWTGGPTSALPVNGTSASAPAFAGIQAIINQRYGRQGQANYVYYRLGTMQSPSDCNSASRGANCVFSDITEGSNHVPCQVGSPDCPDNGVLQYFDAAAGYDPATGLGSVNAANLFYHWDTVSQTQPDFVETAVSNPPQTVSLNEAFQVTDMVLNQGTAAGPSTTRYYLSLDRARNAGDKLLIGTRSVPALDAGASSTGTVTVTVPKTTALGTYYLLACADDTKIIPESNEKNNCQTSAGTVQVQAPDLVESAVSNPPGTVTIGGNFQVTDTVINQGTTVAGASVTRYYLSVDTVRNTGDKLLKGTRAVSALGPGGSSTGTVKVTVPATTAAGTYYLLACGDDTKLVTESNESNNCLASAGTVTVTSSQGGGVINLGQTVSGNLSPSASAGHCNYNAPSDRYSFDLSGQTSSTLVTVAESSTALDSFVCVLDASNNILGQDDDSAGSLNPALSCP